MEIGSLYYLLYYLVITIMTISVCQNYLRYGNDGVGLYFQYRNAYLIVLTLLLIFIIGLRPSARYFTDMGNYIEYMRAFDGKNFHFHWDAQNVIYDNYMNYLCSKRIPPTFLFFTTAVLYFGCMALALKKLFPQDVLLAFLVYLAAFSTLSYGTNGIKAGAAASVFLLAGAYREKRWLSILLALVSLGLHNSMFVVIVGALCVTIYKNPKVYFVFWGFALICALLHISVFQEFFAGISTDNGAKYISSEGTHFFRTMSFRWDFVAYSILPVYIGYKMINTYRIESEGYCWFLNLYLLLNGMWMLCMYSEFTNRIAYLSWFIYPVLTIYPYLNEDVHPEQYKDLTNVVFLQLGFSVFMFFIYYQYVKFI